MSTDSGSSPVERADLIEMVLARENSLVMLVWVLFFASLWGVFAYFVEPPQWCGGSEPFRGARRARPRTRR